MLVDLPIFKYGPPTQDGSNFSDSKVIILPTSKERFLMYKALLMLKTEMLSCIRDTMDSTNSGRFSTLMTPSPNLLLDSTQILVCSSIDHSTLLLT